MLGSLRVFPARPCCARRFNPCAAFGAGNTVLGPLLMKRAVFFSPAAWQGYGDTEYPQWPFPTHNSHPGRRSCRFFSRSVLSPPRRAVRNVPSAVSFIYEIHEDGVHAHRFRNASDVMMILHIRNSRRPRPVFGQM